MAGLESNAQLSHLLAYLRGEGIRIGVLELQRLRFCLDSAPPSNVQGLADLLVALLGKSEQQSTEIRRALDLWLEDLEGDLAREESKGRPRIPTSVVPPGPDLPKAPQRKRRKGLGLRLQLLAGALLVLTSLGLLFIQGQDEPAGTAAIGPAQVQEPIAKTPVVETEGTRARSYLDSVTVDQLTTEPGPIRRAPSTGFALASLAAAGLLGLRISRSVVHRKAAPEGFLVQPSAHLWESRSSPNSSLASLAQQAAWQRSTWDIPSLEDSSLPGRLDLTRTVDATARRAGVIVTVERHAKVPPQFWLLTDQESDSDHVAATAQAALTTLQSSGIPAQAGYFNTLPARILTEDGQTLPLEALGSANERVAVLSDGDGLRDYMDQGAWDKRVSRSFEGLRDLPYVAVFDFSHGRSRLDEWCRSKQVRCLDPEALPKFLGSRDQALLSATSRRRLPRRIAGPLGQWASALALVPFPVDEQRAHLLQEALGLRLHRDAFLALRQAATPTQAGLRWPWRSHSERHPGRSTLMRYWSQAAEDEQVRQQLESAVRFWLEDIGNQVPTEEGALTLPQLRRRLEAASVRLWVEPRAASKTLARLSRHPELAAELRRSLGHLRAQDQASTSKEALSLPWNWEEQDAPTQARLAKAGFGARVLPRAQRALQMHPRWTFACGVSLSLLGLAAWEGVRGQALGPEPQVLLSGPEQSRVRISEIQPSEAGWTIEAVPSRGPAQRTEAQSRQRITVLAESTDVANPTPGAEFDRWYAGSLQPALRTPGERPRRIIGIAIDRKNPASRKLAAFLLDSRACDQVWLGRSVLDAWVDKGLAFADDQFLFLVPDTGVQLPAISAALSQGTATYGAYSLASPEKLLSKLQTLQDPSGTFVGTWEQGGAVSLDWGRGTLPLTLTLPRNTPPANTPPAWEAEYQYPFIEIAGGSFAMGSPEDEEGRYDDEGPVRIVELSPFAMGRFEVTRQLYSQVAAQYPELELKARWKEEPGAERLPANEVTWYEAVRFCNGLSKLAELQQVYMTEGESVEADWSANGYRLPTEAEWEYACRAGSTTTFFWGDDRDHADDLVWLNQDNSDEPRRVGGDAPNDWGLQDMPGSLAEWCWDHFQGDYEGLETRDPKGSKAGGSRVLRGGAFFFDTRVLRSAYRLGLGPEVRVAFIGLRVVRSPVRQPD